MQVATGIDVVVHAYCTRLHVILATCKYLHLVLSHAIPPV